MKLRASVLHSTHAGYDKNLSNKLTKTELININVQIVFGEIGRLYLYNNTKNTVNKE